MNIIPPHACDYLLPLINDTVAYLLKARTVEPEKHPLLANGSETTFVSGQ
jgi:hypothetical protein